MIKTVGNQTFLLSSGVAINLAHVIKVDVIVYYNYEEEEGKKELKGVSLLTTDGEWTYFGSLNGETKGKKVYGDSNVMESIKDLFFS